MTRHSQEPRTFYILFTTNIFFIIIPGIFLLNKGRNEWAHILETSQRAFPISVYPLCLGDMQGAHKNAWRPLLPQCPRTSTSISKPYMATHVTVLSISPDSLFSLSLSLYQQEYNLFCQKLLFVLSSHLVPIQMWKLTWACRRSWSSFLMAIQAARWRYRTRRCNGLGPFHQSRNLFPHLWLV